MLRSLSTSEIVAQVVNFLLLLFFLRLFFWKRVLGLLDARRQRVAAEFESIERQKAESARLRADYEAKLAAIEHRAQEIIKQAFEQGKIISEEARKKAQIAAQEIIDNARESVKYELAQARVALRDELVDLTVKAAEDLIREKITGETDKRMVRDFLEGIDKVA